MTRRTLSSRSVHTHFGLGGYVMDGSYARSRLRLVVAACAAFGACAGEPAGAPSEGERWTLVETARIGSMDGEGTALNSVTGVAVLGDTLLVIEGDPARAARFTRDGRWLGDFAGPGDGPGELRRPGGIGVTDGRVWIADPSGQRLEVYTPTGQHLESIRFQVPADSLGTWATAAALLADSSVLAAPPPVSVGGALSGRLDHQTFYRANRIGAVRGPFYVADVVTTDFFSASLGQGGMEIMGVHPLRESPLVAAFPDGSGVVAVERWAPAAAEDASYRVLVYAADGALGTDKSVAYTPLAGADWLDLFLSEQEEAMSEQQDALPMSVSEVLEPLRQLSPRAYYPPVTELVPGTDGTVWVRRESAFRDSVDWQVLDGDGAVLARLTTSSELAVQATSRTEVRAIETDELDVEYLVGYEVHR